MPWQSQTLCELATAAGYNAEGLAKAADVNKSTAKRVWHEPDWFVRVEGGTLYKLAAVIPGVGMQLNMAALETRRSSVVSRLDRLGVSLNDDALDDALQDDQIAPQYLYTALSAAADIMDEDIESAISRLRSLWGRSQCRALDVVFGTYPSHPVLNEPDDLMAATQECLENVTQTRGFSFRRAVAQAHLAHQIGKWSGELVLHPTEAQPRGLRVRQARSFLRRGSYMGILRQTDDLDMAERYGRLVNDSALGKTIELWAFPSWCGDCEPAEDFSLPGNLTIRRAAREVIREIHEYNDVYVWYLVTTFIPISLQELDPTFGAQLALLQDALEARAERSELESLRVEAANLARQLAKHGSDAHTRVR